MATRKIPAQELERIGTKLLDAAGSPHDESTQVSEMLIRSSLMGHDSHGVLRFVEYVNHMEAGQLKPGGPFEVIQESPSFAIADGHRSWGLLTARKAMNLAMNKARQNGVGTVVIRNSPHIGRLGEYPVMAASSDMIGLVMVNSYGSQDMVAPWGGIEARLSANPVSWAAPTGNEWPFMVDITTSVLPEGKVRVALHAGKKVPEGCLIDHEGKPTTDPAALYGPPPGAILPLGGIVGHKGYGLNLVIELLAGVLSGAGCRGQQKSEVGNGVFLQAIDIAHFIPVAQFVSSVQEMIAHVKSSRTAQGVEEILIPGELEYRTRKLRSAEGIPVSDGTWEQMVNAANKLGISI
jgi:uncharacterized oxidoreductase